VNQRTCLWRRSAAAILCFSGLLALACGVSPRAPESAMISDAQLKADLAVLADARILFGHQSVGANVLDGVRGLVSRLGPGALTIMPDGPASDKSGRGRVVEFKVGENGAPDSKLDAFRTRVERAMATGESFDVVAMKLCYADFGPGTDAGRLFDGYHRVVDAIRSAPASPTVLHVTTPLKTRPVRWKVLVKSLLRRPPETRMLENERRDAYNVLLRRTFAAARVFDLAAVEAGGNPGATGSIPALLDRYSDDGGHLNAEGREAAARAFLHALADAVKTSRARMTSPAPSR
jgi:hypothetical protein